MDSRVVGTAPRVPLCQPSVTTAGRLKATHEYKSPTGKVHSDVVGVSLLVNSPALPRLPSSDLQPVGGLGAAGWRWVSV